MTKRKPLDISLLQPSETNVVTPIQKLEARADGKSPSRVGKVQVSAFVTEDTRKRLKLLAVEQEKSINSLIEESFELLFNKYQSSC